MALRVRAGVGGEGMLAAVPSTFYLDESVLQHLWENI